MKAVLAAAALLVAGASAASAQHAPWQRGLYPYEARHHSVCQDKAFRLHQFERRAAADGRISWRERQIAESLRRDLRRTCGGWRWRG